ncbi:Glp-like protein [Dendrothele bispora CBS 962.96]|uniref:Glp-like protein n=1 Tax=Dendrothele bispora (strain CBS 962.96) TaxID=1314807 RepID=A0A4S8L9I7_DENBC|nr:Glp-like protein [Dendrothele bispora CBS 962.96]
MFSFKSLSLFATVGALVASAHAESHTVIFDNRCKFGTPTLIQGPNVLGTGNGPFNFNGPLNSAIAYLQTGSCGFNGEGCTLIETTLRNPTSPGSGSSTDISLIPPHVFSVTSGFGYFNGCDGAGADCTNPNCPTALTNSGQTDRQVPCQVDNVNLAITFCD